MRSRPIEKVNRRGKIRYNAALIAVSAMYAALLVGGKEAFSALPNVEVVTLLVAVCAYVWGPVVVFPAVNVFIVVDMAIWGVNTWIISYLIHWNTAGLCFWLLGKLKVRRNAVRIVIADIVAVVLTVLFGVLTSFIDVFVGYSGGGFFVDTGELFSRFAVMYTAGISFYATQTVCNAVLFAVVFLPLVRINNKARLRLTPQENASDDSAGNGQKD